MTLPHLYVAGPMTGIPAFNFPAFEAAAADLRAAGYPVTSPHEVALSDGSAAGDHPWQDYVRADLIEMLRHAYAVAVLPGWENSRGANLEVHIAKTLEMPVRPVDEWLSRAQQLAGRSLRPEYPFPDIEVLGVVTGTTRPPVEG
jgi:hypothetical protein